MQIQKYYFYINLFLVCVHPIKYADAQESNIVAAYEQPMTFIAARNGGNCDECIWVAATGIITRNTPAEFEEFLRSGALGSRIVFHSPGGDLLSGLKLGRLIRSHKLHTRVGMTTKDSENASNFNKTETGECSSACAYAFLGGIDRALIGEDGLGGYNSRIGFHQFDSTKTLIEIPEIDLSTLTMSSAQLLTGLIVAYVIEMGVDAQIVSLAGLTPIHQMVYPPLTDLLRLNVIPKNGFSDWKIQPYRNGLYAFSRQSSTKLALQLTAYCGLRENSDYLLLERRINKTSNTNHYLATSTGSVYIGIGDEAEFVPHKKIIRSATGSSEFFNIPLPKNIVKHFIEAEGLNVQMNFPKYMGSGNTIMSLSEQDRKSITLAFKNCSGYPNNTQ